MEEIIGRTADNLPISAESGLTLKFCFGCHNIEAEAKGIFVSLQFNVEAGISFPYLSLSIGKHHFQFGWLWDKK